MERDGELLSRDCEWQEEPGCRLVLHGSEAGGEPHQGLCSVLEGRESGVVRQGAGPVIRCYAGRMLADYAVRVEQSRGRKYPEPHHPYRNDFQRDRDRVVHSRAFRRLEAKTQVFTRRYSDHFRNRLTHTIEVAQIARTIGAQLGLNVQLAEALALAHDIGHPPFGHAGEKALDTVMRRHGLFFDHNLHALRIVDDFELRYAAFRGLNLTFEVREGIIKHSRDYNPQEFPELADYLLDLRPPLEAQLIDATDELAYNTADLDDGYEARLLIWSRSKHIFRFLRDSGRRWCSSMAAHPRNCNLTRCCAGFLTAGLPI